MHCIAATIIPVRLFQTREVDCTLYTLQLFTEYSGNTLLGVPRIGVTSLTPRHTRTGGGFSEVATINKRALKLTKLLH